MHAETHDAPGPVIHHDEHPVRVEDGRFAPKQIHAPQAVFRMTEHSQPRRPRGAWFRLIPSRENPSHDIPIDGNTEGQVICCAIRGQPQLRFRRFISTTAAMTSWLGPFGPGFRSRFDENSWRYFRYVSARCRDNSVDGLKMIAKRINRPGRMKHAHSPATTRSANGDWATVFATDSGSAAGA